MKWYKKMSLAAITGLSLLGCQLAVAKRSQRMAR